jgi:hypothetical protein
MIAKENCFGYAATGMKTCRLTVLRPPGTRLNSPSGVKKLVRSRRMHNSKRIVFPLPVGAEITMFWSDKKVSAKLAL